MMPESTSPEPAVARAAGPGLGSRAISTPTQAVAEPLATTASSLPPSAHTMRRAASSAEVSESGGVSVSPTSLPSSRRCGVSTSGLWRRSSSGKSSSLPVVRRARQLRPSASITRGTSASRSEETTPTVPPVTHMPGPTSVAERFWAISATRPRAELEKVPSGSEGRPTTGISSRCRRQRFAMASGTASVT